MATTTEYMAYRMADRKTSHTGAVYVRCLPLGLVEGSGENGRERVASARIAAASEYSAEAASLHIIPASRVRWYRQQNECWERIDFIERAR